MPIQRLPQKTSFQLFRTRSARQVWGTQKRPNKVSKHFSISYDGYIVSYILSTNVLNLFYIHQFVRVYYFFCLTYYRYLGAEQNCPQGHLWLQGWMSIGSFYTNLNDVWKFKTIILLSPILLNFDFQCTLRSALLMTMTMMMKPKAIGSKYGRLYGDFIQYGYIIFHLSCYCRVTKECSFSHQTIHHSDLKWTFTRLPTWNGTVIGITFSNNFHWKCLQYLEVKNYFLLKLNKVAKFFDEITLLALKLFGGNFIKRQKVEL